LAAATSTRTTPKTGAFAGKVRDGGRKAIAIDGLWTLKPGNGNKGGGLDKL
jgi:hypothetical protein